MLEELLKKQTVEIQKILKEHSIEYLDICFYEDSIMITDAGDLKISSLDGGKTWHKR